MELPQSTKAVEVPRPFSYALLLGDTREHDSCRNALTVGNKRTLSNQRRTLTFLKQLDVFGGSDDSL